MANLKAKNETLEERVAIFKAALTQANVEVQDQSKQPVPRRNTAIGAYGMNLIKHTKFCKFLIRLRGQILQQNLYLFILTQNKNNG